MHPIGTKATEYRATSNAFSTSEHVHLPDDGQSLKPICVLISAYTCLNMVLILQFPSLYLQVQIL